MIKLGHRKSLTISISSLSTLKLCNFSLVVNFAFLMFYCHPVLYFVFLHSSAGISNNVSNMISAVDLKLLVFLPPIFSLPSSDSNPAYKLNRWVDKRYQYLCNENPSCFSTFSNKKQFFASLCCPNSGLLTSVGEVSSLKSNVVADNICFIIVHTYSWATHSKYLLGSFLKCLGVLH